VVYLLKKDDAYLFDQSKVALNGGITAALGYLAGSILMIVLIGSLVISAVGRCHLVSCIMGGDLYRRPPIAAPISAIECVELLSWYVPH
jgi:uncharacterized Tic20 family protein